jgi:predicted  nucleic acid-binding Zn-ribbon protein
MKYQEYNSHVKDYKNAEQEYKAIEDEMMMLSKNLMDISNMQFQSQDSLDDLIQSVELYQEQIRNEKRVIENKRERNNDQVKEVNSYVQIKQADLHEYF